MGLRTELANLASLSRRDLVDTTTLEVTFTPFTSHREFASHLFTRLVARYKDPISVERLYLGEVNSRQLKDYAKISRHDLTTAPYLIRRVRSQGGVNNSLYDDYGISVKVLDRDTYSSPDAPRGELTAFVETYVHTYRLTDTTTLSLITGVNLYAAILYATDLSTHTIDSIVDFWKVYHETGLVYKRSDYIDVIDAFNSLMGSKKTPYIPSSSFYRARDIKLDDFLGGGLADDVRVGYKTDGYRRAYFVLGDATWLLYGSDAYLVDNTHPIHPNGTILDGEYVPLERRNNAPYPTLVHYVVYDALFHRGIDLRSQFHDSRLATLRRGAIVTDNLYLIVKNFITVNGADSLFASISTLEAAKPATYYHTDGYMFISNKCLYRNPTVPLSERTLSNLPDMVKWKPIGQLTVDLKVTLDDEGRVAVVDYPQFGAPDLASLRGVVDGSIIEFRVGDSRTLIAVRVRTDKEVPNNRAEVGSILALVQSPITLDVLTGESLSVMKKVHNRIKRRLVESAAAVGADHKYLLGLGEGVGANMDSWHKYDRVIAVEPNEQSVVEMERRLSAAEIPWVRWNPDAELVNAKVVTVLGVAQDHELVAHAVDAFFGADRASVVSMIFSLTFFRGDSLDALIRVLDYSLRPGGAFVYATMDGAALSAAIDTFDGTIDAKTPKGELLYSIRKAYDDVEIYVGGGGLVGERDSSGVTYQREYYAYPMKIFNALFDDRELRSSSMRLGFTSAILNKYERYFSRLCVGGTFYGKASMGQRVRNARQCAWPLVELGKRQLALESLGDRFYRRVPATGDRSLYDAIIDSFYVEDVSRGLTAKRAVMAMQRAYGPNALYAIAYELKLGIVTLDACAEVTDELLFSHRPFIVVMKTKSRATPTLHYELVFRRDSLRRGAKEIPIEYTLFRDPIDVPRRVEARDGALVVQLPNLHNQRRRLAEYTPVELGHSIIDETRPVARRNVETRGASLNTLLLCCGLERRPDSMVVSLAASYEELSRDLNTHYSTYAILWDSWSDAYVSVLCMMCMISNPCRFVLVEGELWLIGNLDDSMTIRRFINDPSHMPISSEAMNADPYFISTVRALFDKVGVESSAAH